MSDVRKLTPAMLAALLCARICHDLVSPVGALGAALEVFDDEDNLDMRDDAIDLIRVSSRQASAKLQFLRLAFGAGGSSPGIISTQQIMGLADGVYGDAKASLNWNITAEGLDKPAARVLLNLIMLAVQAVPRGGDVNIEGTVQAGMTRLNLVSTGPKARLSESVVKGLAGQAPEEGWDGRTVQPFYVGMIAREASGRVEARLGEERVEFVSLIPQQKEPIKPASSG